MFQGMKFAAAGDVYSLASAKINENYILSQVITDEPDCVAKCQSMKGILVLIQTVRDIQSEI